MFNVFPDGERRDVKLRQMQRSSFPSVEIPQPSTRMERLVQLVAAAAVTVCALFLLV